MGFGVKLEPYSVNATPRLGVRTEGQQFYVKENYKGTVRKPYVPNRYPHPPDKKNE